MRVHIGGDHAAFELHQELLTFLAAEGHEVTDHGPFEYDAVKNIVARAALKGIVAVAA